MEDTIVPSDRALKEKKRVFIGLDPERIVWEGFIDRLTEHLILMYVECGDRLKAPMFPSQGKAFVRMPSDGGGLVLFESEIVKPKSADGKLWLMTKPPKVKLRQRRAFFRVPYDKPVLMRVERSQDTWTDWDEVPLVDISGGGFSVRYPEQLQPSTRAGIFLRTPDGSSLQGQKIDILTEVVRCSREHDNVMGTQWRVGLKIAPELTLAKQSKLMNLITDLQRDMLKRRIRN
jgi:c-di-GMP-binding flagellar brake protein YcgR